MRHHDPTVQSRVYPLSCHSFAITALVAMRSVVGDGVTLD
jgi:hypothetical protein